MGKLVGGKLQDTLFLLASFSLGDLWPVRDVILVHCSEHIRWSAITFTYFNKQPPTTKESMILRCSLVLLHSY
jgi:hypothetical protein